MLYKLLLKCIINAVDTEQGLLKEGLWIIIMLEGFGVFSSAGDSQFSSKQRSGMATGLM